MKFQPYVVSSDLQTLWSRAGIILPKDALEQFRLGICSSLETIFGRCDWIAEAELNDGVKHLIEHSAAPIVSLDDVYAHDQELCIDTTRLHSQTGEFLGLGSRDGQLGTLGRQVHNIVTKHPSMQEVALIDDVLFSGALCTEIVGQFRARGVNVLHVYAGVAIGEGIDQMTAIDCKVKAVRRYDFVADQICERDFMPGAPLSGRTVAGLVNTGMPYVLPYGRPTEWASIPKAHAATFSARCLRLSAEIYRQLGMKQVDLPRNIHGLTISDNAFIHELLLAAAEDL